MSPCGTCKHANLSDSSCPCKLRYSCTGGVSDQCCCSASLPSSLRLVPWRGARTRIWCVGLEMVVVQLPQVGNWPEDCRLSCHQLFLKSVEPSTGGLLLCKPSCSWSLLLLVVDRQSSNNRRIILCPMPSRNHAGFLKERIV